MTDLIVAIVLTLLVQAMISATVVAPAVLAPVAQGDIGIAASWIGVFTSLIYATATLSAPLGGTMVARQGAVRVSQYCLLFAGTGFALCALAHPFVLVAGALLIGCGYGPITPASSEILAARTPPRIRNLVMSIRQSGVPVGGALAGVLVPLLLMALDWQATVLVIAASCFFLAILLQAVREQYDSARHDAPQRPRPSLMALMRMVFTHAELRRAALTSFAYGGIQWCLASFVVVFLTERGALSLSNAGFALSAAMTGGIVGRVLWAAVADYIGNARIVLGTLGIVMSLSAFVMSQVSPDWPLAAIFVLCTVFGASAIGWNGVYIAEIARIMPVDKVALATGASLAVTYLGVVVTPFLFWLLLTVTGSYAVAFIVVGILTFIASLAYFRRVSWQA